MWELGATSSWYLLACVSWTKLSSFGSPFCAPSSCRWLCGRFSSEEKHGKAVPQSLTNPISSIIAPLKNYVWICLSELLTPPVAYGQGGQALTVSYLLVPQRTIQSKWIGCSGPDSCVRNFLREEVLLWSKLCKESPGRWLDHRGCCPQKELMLSSHNELVLMRVAWCTDTNAGSFCLFSCFAGSSLVLMTDSLLASLLCCNAVRGRGCSHQSLNQKDGHRFCDGYVFCQL